MQFWERECDVRITDFSESNDNTDNRNISTALKNQFKKLLLNKLLKQQTTWKLLGQVAGKINSCKLH
jgi:hypothetical protein